MLSYCGIKVVWCFSFFIPYVIQEIISSTIFLVMDDIHKILFEYCPVLIDTPCIYNVIQGERILILQVSTSTSYWLCSATNNNIHTQYNIIMSSIHVNGQQHTGWAKKWHPFGIWVSSLVRCIIYVQVLFTDVSLSWIGVGLRLQM